MPKDLQPTEASRDAIIDMVRRSRYGEPMAEHPAKPPATPQGDARTIHCPTCGGERVQFVHFGQGTVTVGGVVLSCAQLSFECSDGRHPFALQYRRLASGQVQVVVV
jgi:hypothetical protein